VAYDERLAERIRETVSSGAAGEPVEEKKMFGGLAFLLGGHMAVAASGQGGLMVRCAPEDTEALVEEPGASRMEMRGRSMDGWLRVSADAVDGEPELDLWVDRGLAYARSLPPK
jgi:TfoX/Sxy family transcriptional regulator of competence genes